MPGVRGGAAVDVDDADLPLVAALVLLEQPVQRHRRGRAVVEVRQGQALVGDVGVRLGRDRADSGDRGRYGGPDGEELRRHGHPPGLSVGGPGHDREGHGPHDSEPETTAAADTRLPSTAVEVPRSTGAPSARLPVRRPPPAVRHRDRHRRGRQRRVHADLDALLPRRHRPDPGAGRRARSRWPAWSRCPTGPLIGSVVDRVGAKQVLLAGNVLQGAGFVAYLFSDSLRRGDAPGRSWSPSAGPRSGAPTATSSPRSRCRGSGRSGSASSGALRNVGFALGGLVSGLAITIGTQTAYAAVVVANAVSYAVAFVLLLAVPGDRARPSTQPTAGLVGDGAARRGPTGCCGSRQLAFSMSMMVLNFAMPVYATTCSGCPAG